MSEQKKKSDENFDIEKCTSHCILFEWLREKKQRQVIGEWRTKKSISANLENIITILDNQTYLKFILTFILYRLSELTLLQLNLRHFLGFNFEFS